MYGCSKVHAGNTRGTYILASAETNVVWKVIVFTGHTSNETYHPTGKIHM